MLNHKQIVLAAGAAMMVSALAMVPRDADARSGGGGFWLPIDIIERVGPPSYKAPTEDARSGGGGFWLPIDIVERVGPPSYKAPTGDATARRATVKARQR